MSNSERAPDRPPYRNCATGLICYTGPVLFKCSGEHIDTATKAKEV
jgi:hypothetical protein